MARVEKTVFISYRRTNAPWALAIFQNLNNNGYDVFFDFNGIASGDFESVILGNIKARAHFLVLLTPSALERCGELGDWLRREIETALETKRNIVPLMLEGFDFSTPAIANQLTGKLADLKRYNALGVPAEYFMEAMERLRQRYLNVELDAVIHPASLAAQRAAAGQQAAADTAPKVQEEELTAQQWFERGFEAKDFGEQIRFYSQAIRLKSDFAQAFNNRGFARHEKGDLVGAFEDCNEAIRLKPDFAYAFLNRGRARHDKGDRTGAIEDYDEAIRLKPDCAKAFYNRGNVRREEGDLTGAIKEYDEAIRLKPDYPDAFINRGVARRQQGDLTGAVEDYNESIRLQPDSFDVFNNRGVARKQQGDLTGAIMDYNESIRLKPDYAIAFNNRGAALKDKGDLAGAMKDYNEAIRLKPDYANALNNRAKLYEDRGEHAAAMADLQKYLDLGGTARDGEREEVEQKIRDLRKKVKEAGTKKP